MRDLYANLETVGGRFRHVDQRTLVETFMVEVTNWLAATRLYLENNRDFLARDFGENSSELLGYLETTRKVFDSSPAYRFLYNLRDFSQHCGPPIGGIVVSRSNVPGHRSLEVFLSSSELLQASFNWSRHSKSLLEQWPEQIILFPLIEEAMLGFKEIESYTLGVLIAKCDRAVPVLREGIGKVGPTSGFPAIFHFQQSGRVQISHRSFPKVDDLDKIQQFAARGEEIEVTDITGELASERNPEQDHAESEAIAVISAWLEDGPGKRLDEFIRGILQGDGDIAPLICGLINISGYLLMTLSKALGGTPQSILGGLVPKSKGA